jgi:hypothetical protein
MQEKEWFYRRTQDEKQGPVPESAIRAMIDRGELMPPHELWTPGMTEWVRVDRVPDFRPPPAEPGPATPAVAAPTAAVAPAAPAAGANTIGGAIGVLSCIGLPTGILQIVGGISLFGAKTALEGQGDVEATMVPFLQKLKLFMLMQGIVFLLGLILVAIAFIFYFGAIMAIIAGGLEA